jgi:hypothetical protein
METSTALPSRKPAPSALSFHLTPQEIESLRQDALEGHKWALEALKDVMPLDSQPDPRPAVHSAAD